MTDIDHRVGAIEAQLVEQEHRPLHVLNNFFIVRHSWPRDDPRRTAALKAFLWNALLFLFPTAAVVSGVAFAVIGVVVQLQALNRMDQQNQLLATQNGLLELERRKTTLESASPVIASLPRDIGDVGPEAEMAQAVAREKLALLTLLSRQLPPVPAQPLDPVTQLGDLIISDWGPPAMGATEPMPPKTDLSAERGVIALGLGKWVGQERFFVPPPSLDLTFSDLRGIVLDGFRFDSWSLQGACFLGSSLLNGMLQSPITGADLRYTYLTDVQVSGDANKADFSRSDLRNVTFVRPIKEASFTNALMLQVQFFADVGNADFSGASICEEPDASCRFALANMFDNNDTALANWTAEPIAKVDEAGETTTRWVVRARKPTDPPAEKLATPTRVRVDLTKLGFLPPER